MVLNYYYVGFRTITLNNELLSFGILNMQNCLETLLLSKQRLKSLAFSNDVVDHLIDFSSCRIFQQRFGKAKPTLVGFIGCTGTGKSTIINSLLSKDLCITGWKAHNTLGPVLLSSNHFYRAVCEFEESLTPFFFPAWNRDLKNDDKTTNEKGSVDSLEWILLSQAPSESLVLIDLPDINTTLSWDENLLAIQIQHWLDVVVYVVDEETLYHREYEHTVAIANRFHQKRLCVLNNRGQDRVDLNHPDFQKTMQFFGINTIHVLPKLQNTSYFKKEPEFLALKKELFHSKPAITEKAIMSEIGNQAQKIILENEKRLSICNELDAQIIEVVDEESLHETTIPINRILNDDALNVLEHLGLKRFSVSNILQFFKRTAKTGSISKQFRLAFGDNRQIDIHHLIHIDFDKLKIEVTARLSDHRERILQTILSHPDEQYLSTLLPDLRSTFQQSKDEQYEKLQDVIDSFEMECRELIQSDTLASSIKNDPLISVAVFLVLIADFLTIPGFGSWVLVPTAFKYLPFGKFESCKRKFQQSIRHTIRDYLYQDLHQFRVETSRIALRDSDSLILAMKRCVDEI
jgi:hypothetical protein